MKYACNTLLIKPVQPIAHRFLVPAQYFAQLRYLITVIIQQHCMCPFPHQAALCSVVVFLKKSLFFQGY
jgi:hypothetical protein